MAFKYRITEGKNPKTGAAMFYGVGAETNTVKVDNFIDQIVHSTTLTKADVRAVLVELEYCIMRHMQNNESVRLGTLGSFCPRLRCNAAASPALWLPNNIKGIHCGFTPSSDLKYALKAGNPDVKFKQIEQP